MSYRSGSIAGVVALATSLAACGGDSTGPTNTADPCTTGPSGSANAAFSAAGVFTVSPIPLSAISFVTPLGNLNPPNHVYPTDHIFIIPTNGSAGSNSVSAAAAGTIVDKYQPGGT